MPSPPPPKWPYTVGPSGKSYRDEFHISFSCYATNSCEHTASFETYDHSSFHAWLVICGYPPGYWVFACSRTGRLRLCVPHSGTADRLSQISHPSSGLPIQGPGLRHMQLRDKLGFSYICILGGPRGRNTLGHNVSLVMFQVSRPRSRTETQRLLSGDQQTNSQTEIQLDSRWRTINVLRWLQHYLVKTGNDVNINLKVSNSTAISPRTRLRGTEYARLSVNHTWQTSDVSL